MKSLSDITAPVPVARKLLEVDVQKKCVDWARARGYWARKFSSISQRSVPDFLFAKHPVKFACEFKAPGKLSTDAQRDEQQLMCAAGWRVLADCSDFEKFKAWVMYYEKECAQ